MTLSGRISGLNFDFATGKAILSLSVNETQEVKNLYDKLHDCEKLSVKIDKFREKRSLNANNYAWLLMTELADNQGITKEEVYRNQVREIGVCRQVEISENAVDTLLHSWSLHGLAWFGEILDYSEHENFVTVVLYYGSSTYNKNQMSRLIDNIVQDCKAVGIETKTPEQIASLLNLWKAGEQ